MNRLFTMVMTLLLLTGTSALAAGKGHGGKAKQPGGGVVNRVATLEQQLSALQSLVPPASATVNVDCANGESIGDALLTPATDLAIVFSGNCVESPRVERDRVTITGEPGATITGELQVVESTRVRLADFAIANSPNTGLLVGMGAMVRANALSVSGSAGSGIVVYGGSLICADCNSSNNLLTGLYAGTGARLVLAGATVANGNATGIEAAYSAAITVSQTPADHDIAGSDNQIEISNNQGFGVLVYGAAALGTTENTDVLISDNGIGIIIASGGTMHMIGSYEVTGSESLGVAALGGTVFLNTVLDTNNNNIGIYVDDNGTIRGGGIVNATDNFFGFFARAGFLGDMELNASGNANAGLVLLGGTMTIPGGTVTGNVGCDGTEVLNTPFACGEN